MESDGGLPLFLVVDVEAPPRPSSGGDPHRVPLNLALVVDASGSMTGERLGAAKQAAAGVLRRLTREDVVSVVSFAEDHITHVDRIHPDGPALQQALASIARVTPRGWTDLSEGWLRGAELVALSMERPSEARHRVVLLSDGKANRGIQDRATLRVHAEELRNRGLLTSTVGIGDDYSTEQLEVLAESGGGRLHDAEHADEIPEVVLAELEEAETTFAEEIIVAVRCPTGTTMASIGHFPEQAKGSGCWTRLGALIHGSRRTVVYRIENPREIAWDAHGFTVVVDWRPLHGTDHGEGTSVRVEPMPESGPVRDPEVSRSAALAWQAAIVREVTALNRDGEFSRAARILQGQLTQFRDYAAGLPSVADLVTQLEQLGEVVGRPMQARLHKEIAYASYRNSTSTADSRRARPRRDVWELVAHEARSKSARDEGSHSEPVPLIGLGGPASRKVPFWRLSWELLECDPRPTRFMIAPEAGGERLLVAKPDEFASVVMSGPRSNYMESESWAGTTDWAKQEGKGGGYLQNYAGMTKFDSLKRSWNAFIEALPPEVDLIVHERLNVRVERMSKNRLEWVLREMAHARGYATP
jgi:Ca-activated chloride channel family protein